MMLLIHDTDMRKTLFVLTLIFCSICGFAQTIGVRTLDSQKKESIVLPSYDTTFVYFDLGKLKNNPHFYDNQEILISPNLGDKMPYSHYDGFSVEDSVEVTSHPDTVWVKKRKKVRDGDFYITYPKSNVYHPNYIDGEIVRYIGKPYYRSFGKRVGFFTPCEYVDGKPFTIISVTYQTEGGKYIFRLLDETGVILNFTWPSSYLYDKEECFPTILMTAYINKCKNMYVGKTFHLKDDALSLYEYVCQDIATNKYRKVDGDFTCTDLSLVKNYGGDAKIDNTIGEQVSGAIFGASVRLFFQDNNGCEFCIPVEGEYISNLNLWGVLRESYDNFKGSTLYSYIGLNNIMLAEEYYTQKAEKEAEKEAAEKRRIEEEKQQLIERTNMLIKKYGKKYANMILEGKVQIGMTAEMCRESWGLPDDINRSTGTWGVHEQWCYDWGGYLYFDNGKLTSIQN